MTVEATISASDFPVILSSYDVGEYRGFRTFANGAGQTTVLLETSRRKVVLRYYENRTDKHVDFEAQLAAFLNSNGDPVPAIIKTRAGEVRGTYKGKPHILVEFMEGEHGANPIERFDAGKAALAVGAVARLHDVTRGYHPAYFSSRAAFDTAYCRGQFQRKHQALIETEEGRWFKAELDRLVLPPDLPHGLCHADLYFGNFLFREGKVVAVIDFDMSFYGVLIYDIASLIYWWAMPPGRGVRSEAARFIVCEYDEHRPLSGAERAHIIDALKLIVLLGISWSDRSEISSQREMIEALNAAGKEIFG